MCAHGSNEGSRKARIQEGGLELSLKWFCQVEMGGGEVCSRKRNLREQRPCGGEAQGLLG